MDRNYRADAVDVLMSGPKYPDAVVDRVAFALEAAEDRGRRRGWLDMGKRSDDPAAFHAGLQIGMIMERIGTGTVTRQRLHSEIGLISNPPAGGSKTP